ncbi:MAG: DUF6603 domain-containing protein [Acidimicrobiales bacterium]
MPDQAGTLERVAEQLAAVLEPISTLLDDEEVLDTLALLGVAFPEELLTEPTITAARQTVVGAAEQLGPLTTELAAAIEAEDVARMTAASVSLVTQCVRLVVSFDELVSALQAAGPTLPGVTAAQVAELVTDLPRKLLDLLLVELIELSAPVGAVLTVLGVVEREFRPGDPTDPTKPDHERIAVRLDRLLPAVTDPVRHLTDLYQWGQPAFDALPLLSALETALARLGLPVLLRPPSGADPAVLEAFALDLRPSTGEPGLHVDVVLPAALDTTFTFPVSPPTWMADVRLAGTVVAGASGDVRAPFEISLTAPTASTEGTITVGLHARPEEPFVVLGQAGGSRLEFAELGIEGGVTLVVDSGGTATASPVADGGITGGRLVIDASQGDGFLTTLLGGGRIESTFDVGFAFAADTGLRFHGSGALEIQVPVHVQLGPVEIQAVYVVARLAGATVPLELSAGFAAKLGVLEAAVDRLGVIATLGFPPGGGNIGPAQLDFRFKPPNGVGLAVNAGVVKGGGYLFIDAERGEYAGALELTFADFLSLKAIGIITTRLPDGSPGFSLLVIITAEFGTGIQLGFGFTLIGVGGLLGLNRTMRLQPLLEGVRTGAIESIMFPRDVVANAPRIISDLRTIFPPQQGTFLIGPMAKLGWGTPTLVSVSVGVIIEIPGNVAIVGVLRVVLPADDAAILVLQVNFAGAIEFDRSRLYFFASLFESRVLYMTIEGEMGLLVAWGGDADFVLSVGGFHPQFSPPPLPFPSPQRVAIDILSQPASRIRVEGYFAVTSNTAQFGARVELRLGFDDFGLEGHLAFDALFRFSPFAFVIQISASVSLKAFGVGCFSVRLNFALEGPTPWRAHGTGSISLLFFDISADFDITWGEARDTSLPPMAVLPLVAGELGKIEGWRALLPAGAQLFVTPRKLDTAVDALVLHPVGVLRIEQRGVPLDLTIDKVGAQKPSDANRFSVSAVGGGLAKVGDVDEMFAMAQFQDMDDATKLSRRPFEPQHGGVDLAPEGASITSTHAVTRTVRYEQIIIDTNFRRFVRRFASFFGVLFAHFLHGNAISRSPLAAQQRLLLQPFDEVIAVRPDEFAVAFTVDNSVVDDQAAFASEASAADYLARQVAANPGLAGSVHVIPTAELVGVASE